MTAPALQPQPRWWDYVKARRVDVRVADAAANAWRTPRIPCPDGHHFPETFHMPEHGFARCEEWLKAERRSCGRWVYVFAIRGGGCIVTEVSLDEKRHVEQIQTPGEILEYLGLWEALMALAEWQQKR